MTVTRRTESRRTETPNAVMTTLASPTQGGAQLAVWRVQMRAGQQGPAHMFDSQQVWTALAGAATVELAGERIRLAAGDTLVIAPTIVRRIGADAGTRFEAIVASAAGARAALEDGTDRGVPAWIA
jgi:quercetin dioxygenase-like cupin family protein